MAMIPGAISAISAITALIPDSRSSIHHPQPITLAWSRRSQHSPCFGLHIPHGHGIFQDFINVNEAKIAGKFKQKKGTRIIFEAPVQISGKAEFHCSLRVGAFTNFISGRIRGLEAVGRHCDIANDVKIGEVNHPISWLSTSSFQYSPTRFGWHDKDLITLAAPFVSAYKSQRKPPVIIGHNVWIGAGAHILRGVKIGHGAIIAAGSVVTSDVLPYEIVGGVPAKHIRFRFPEDIVTRLLNVAWWQYHPLDLRGVHFPDIQLALDQMEKMQATGEISPWEGEWFRLEKRKVSALDQTRQRTPGGNGRQELTLGRGRLLLRRWKRPWKSLKSGWRRLLRRRSES